MEYVVFHFVSNLDFVLNLLTNPIKQCNMQLLVKENAAEQGIHSSKIFESH
jgi:hypothetical protein